MKKLFIFIAVFMLAFPVRADFLQTADEKAVQYKFAENEKGEKAADELKDYVLHSGAAEDCESEMERIAMRNYMLNLKRQRLGFAQGLYIYAYDLSEKNPKLDSFTDRAYQCAYDSNLIQKEIEQNEKYFSKLAKNNKSETVAARKKAENLPEEKSGYARLILDLCLCAVLAVVICILWKMSSKFLDKRGIR